MLSGEEQQKEQQQETLQVSPQQEETFDWDEWREELARRVDEKLALARKALEIERSLELIRHPKETIKLAKEAADQLYAVIKRRPDWVVTIEGREFLTFPAWQFLATFFGLMPSISDIKDIRDDETHRLIGFEVTAVVHNRFGEEITRAVARADRNEVVPEYEYITLPDGRRRRGKLLGYKPRFEHKPDHVVLATAQTRAMRRALWQTLNFVVGLAGYEPTPAEEVVEEEVGALPEEEEELVTPNDWAKFWAEVKRMGWKPDEVHALFGVKTLTEIVRTKTQLNSVLAQLKAKKGGERK